MKIAVAANKAAPDAIVPDTLKGTKNLLIVETDRMEVTAIVDAPKKDAECELARAVVKHNCEAILCGDIESDAFDILCADGISRMRASGLTATQAVVAMLNFGLEYIKDCVGGFGCPGESDLFNSEERQCHPHD